jgi:hypothetical protein
MAAVLWVFNQFMHRIKEVVGVFVRFRRFSNYYFALKTTIKNTK